MLTALDLLTANDDPGKHAPSYYAATANRQTSHAPLEGARTCDVCVIGGGYTGLSAALHLAERGQKVMLLEANRVGWGPQAAMVDKSGPDNVSSRLFWKPDTESLTPDCYGIWPRSPRRL